MKNLPQYNKKPSKKHQKKIADLSARNVLLGNYGEKYIKRFLVDSGYFAKKPRSKRFAGDLWTINKQTNVTSKIEVKCALESASGDYCFCLRKENHTDCCYSDYVILLCIDKYSNHYVYCIPCKLLQTQCLKITSHPTRYAGKYSAFRIREHINFDHTETVGELWMR